MRNTFLASAAILTLGLAPALAQQQWAHQPGTGESGPAATTASNIDAADTKSDIAPHFPSPDIGPNAAPVRYLKAAEVALNRHRTGEADQALEMAETRALDRSTLPANADKPDRNRMVMQISMARQAIGHNDLAAARRDIAMALSDSPMAREHAQTMGMQPSNAAPTGVTGMAASGAGAAPGASAGASMGGGNMGTGTTDSAGGAR